MNFTHSGGVSSSESDQFSFKNSCNVCERVCKKHRSRKKSSCHFFPYRIFCSAPRSCKWWSDSPSVSRLCNLEPFGRRVMEDVE